jgi:hypothetical protein
VFPLFVQQAAVSGSVTHVALLAVRTHVGSQSAQTIPPLQQTACAWHLGLWPGLGLEDTFPYCSVLQVHLAWLELCSLQGLGQVSEGRCALMPHAM